MSVVTSPEVQSTDIAVVGLAGRFPGARNTTSFWRNLRNGVESIRALTHDELVAAGVDAATLADPRYVKAAAVLDDLPGFDAGFFGFSAREAAILDPQHRHFLEVAWEALEDAGHVPERFAGPIGVFAGCGMNAYFMFNLLTNPALVSSVGLFLLRHTGNDKDFLTTRASYCLNLTGPSIGIQTACSTSLVAVHAACQSLLSGECDLALAGGVTIEVPHGRGYLYEEGEILSPDGHCRAFDAASKGTVFGSGAGVAVLRRLADALDSGDHIRAVIKGSAVNNDGAGKAGYLAPSVDGQAKAIREALSVANVSARTVRYVETHGTGTPVGDPIEIAALTQAFRADTDDRGYCAIGSVKTNIGHLDTASGIASLIKAVLALQHREIPPSLNFAHPNPAIDFPATPFVVNPQLTPFERGAHPRRASVNSLGVGGTNAHVIVEEAPAPRPTAPPRSRSLLVVSARSAEAVEHATDRLADHLAGQPGLDLADVSFTLQTGRRAFPHRRVAVGAQSADLVEALRRRDPKRVWTRHAAKAAPAVVFLFPGGGAQYPNMGRDLYEGDDGYRGDVDRCLAFVKSTTGRDLGPLMFPAPADVDAAAAALTVPSNSVLAVFIAEYALARLWMSWGVTPAAMTGHSLGEYSAACLAGVLTLEDALTLVAVRGALFDRMPAGAMLSVPLGEAALRPLLPPGVSLAALNAPDLVVASGPVEAIADLERTLAARDVETRRLHIAVAAHSPMLDARLPEFAARVAAVAMRPATVPFISNRTGTWALPADLAAPDYWVRHLRDAVQFSTGLTTILDRLDAPVMLEVGPGQALTALARLHLPPALQSNAIASSRHADDSVSDLESLYGAAGRVWAAGVDLDWTAFHGSRRRRVALPTYPFEHQSYWIAPGVAVHAESPSPAPAAPAPIARLANVDAWFSVPVWRPAPSVSAATGAARPRRVLLFAGGTGLSGTLAHVLERRGLDVVTVTAAERFAELGPRSFTLRPGARDDLEALVGALAASSGGVPPRVVHLWTCDPEGSGDDVQARGFDTLVGLAQALGALSNSEPLAIDVVTAGLERVGPDDVVVSPERATALGPVLVIPRELPHLSWRAIDVATGHDDAPDVVNTLADEVLGSGGESRVALRDGRRWTETLEPVALPAAGSGWLRPGGRYVVTGGLSGMGLELARRMAAAAPVVLTLIGRHGLPPRERWGDIAAASPRERRAVHAILDMEAAGATVHAVAVDVTDPVALKAALASAGNGSATGFDGLIHAAGLIDDAPAQTKDLAAMHRVIAPKLEGLRALETAWAAAPPAWVVLCSSTSARLGLPGQVDYAAANAYLNAYARARAGDAQPRVVALEWGAWRAVGMAARAVGAEIEPPRIAAGAMDAAIVHPLLGAIAERTPDTVTFLATYAVATHWMLDEHRLRNGRALVPGTAYVELARAAFAAVVGEGPVEIRDLFFVAPLDVDDDERRAVRTVVSRAGDAWSLEVSSETADGWIEHARATLAPIDDAPAVTARRDALLAWGTSTAHLHDHGHDTRQEAHLRFGPRWKNLHEVTYGAGYAVARLELAPRFAGDLAQWPLHPALLDLATAAGLPLLPDSAGHDGLFVPLSYDSVRVYAPLPPRLWSTVRPAVSANADVTTVEFDAVLTDDDERVLVEARGFLMRRTAPGEVAARLGRGAGLGAGETSGDSRLAAVVRAGIAPDEGWTALARVLQAPALANVVVSSIDVAALRVAPAAPVSRTARPAGVRPPSQTPLGSTEQTIADMWADLLGVDDVGPDDDFFELGGHSLIAVRLVARMEKAFAKKLRLATLFDARTVRSLAAVVEDRAAVSPWVSLVPVQPAGHRPPVFCVHAVGGDVLAYAALAARLGPEQPFYGFRAVGHDGVSTPHTTVHAQAAFYVDELLAFRPEGPYLLCGYSHGGRVALEMAHRLKDLGRDVAFLGAIDVSPAESLARGWAYPLRWLHNLPRWFWYDGRRSTVPDNLDRVRRLLRKLGRQMQARFTGAEGTAARVDDAMNIAQLPDDIQEIFRSNFLAFRTYVPRPYDGPVTLFRATGQPVFTSLQPDLGWAQVASGPITVRHVPGNHLSILWEPEVEGLANELQAALLEAQTARSSSAA